MEAGSNLSQECSRVIPGRVGGGENFLQGKLSKSKGKKYENQGLLSREKLSVQWLNTLVK